MSRSEPSRADPLTPRQVRRLGRALPRPLRFTREGKLLFFVTLGIGFGAVNSGNNLLYLVLGVLLSLIMVSGVLSELTLRGVRAVRHEPPTLEAGHGSLVRVDLHNAKRRFASLSIEAEEMFRADRPVRQRRGMLLSLGAGESRSVHLRIEGTRRGRLPSAGLRVSTRFPFGFFEKSRLVPVPTRYVVLPAAEGTELPPVRPRTTGNEEEIARVGQGDEFYGLRDARPGDDARSIAWKVTARRDKPIIREHQRPAAHRVVLVLANVVPAEEPEADGGAPGRYAGASERLEEAVTTCAGLAASLVEGGYRVGVATAEGHVEPDAGPAALARVREYLAGLPVRTVPPGTRVPLHDGAAGPGVERVAVVPVDQEQAGLAPVGEHVVRVGEAPEAAVPAGAGEDEETAARPPTEEDAA